MPEQIMKQSPTNQVVHRMRCRAFAAVSMACAMASLAAPGIAGGGNSASASFAQQNAPTRAKAFETADVDQLVAVLTEDARWEMPPIATWFEGRDTIVAFLAKQMRIIGTAKLVATSANGQPAFAVYARGQDGQYQPHAIHVLTLTPQGVSRIVAFHGSGLFPLFGL